MMQLHDILKRAKVTPPETRCNQHAEHWAELHEFKGVHVAEFYNKWFDSIPRRKCDCKTEWRRLARKYPPPLSEPAAFWRWGIDRHNDVNRKLGKPVVTHDEAAALYRPHRYSPGSFEVPFVTALSRMPKHVERQSVCLESWQRFGAHIIAVNTAEEIADLQAAYPMVDEWLQCDEVSTDYAYPTQLIRNLAGVAVQRNEPVIVVNSDIEARGSQDQLRAYLANDSDVQVLGVRWNYAEKHPYWMARQFQWGIDAVTFTPEQAARIPTDFPMAIGQAMWDYAIPYFQLEAGGSLRLMHERFWFHEDHPTNWHNDAWLFGAEWMESYSGLPVTNQKQSAIWRESWTPCNYNQDAGQYLTKDGSRPSPGSLIDLTAQKQRRRELLQVNGL